MKKEIILAILLGLSLGLFITYGLYRTQNTSDDNQTATIDNNLSSSPAVEALSTLAIHSPDDESIVADPKVTIAGDTEPNNFVVILVNAIELITTADDSGAFSVSTELEAGSNVIMVYSIDEDGKTTTEERLVVYTTRALTDTAPTTDATASATTDDT